MEGPSLILAAEELRPFLKKRARVGGARKKDFSFLAREKLERVESWGKHFLLIFSAHSLRVHFLMFGSYRINDPRENRVPKLTLSFGRDVIYFYSCAIKASEGDLRKEYDWSNDVMSKEWDAKAALRKLRAKPRSELGDALMDQAIFAGVGNIIKNEVLFRLRLHPEEKWGNLTARTQRKLVEEAVRYSHQFYEWKKINQLKKNWKIFRKKKCPVCAGRVTKKATGVGQRVSHFCARCQPRIPASGGKKDGSRLAFKATQRRQGANLAHGSSP